MQIQVLDNTEEMNSKMLFNEETLVESAFPDDSIP